MSSADRNPETSTANGRVVAAVAGDPGGARALAPALVCLRERGFLVVVHAYREALSILADGGFSPIEVSETIDIQHCIDKLMQDDVKSLLTATSINDAKLELRFILAARQLQIPSVSLLDFWTNYRMRFEDFTGCVVLPDQLAVMDQQAADEINQAGLVGVDIVVTGQPAFDGLNSAYRHHLESHRTKVRNELGIGGGDSCLLFLSQPLSLVYGDDPSAPSHPGFTERTVLRDTLRVVSQVSPSEGEIRLIVRPHPRESVEDYDWIHQEYADVHVSAEGNLHESLIAADVVMGMNSVALIEACYLRCVVLSYQPGLRTADCLPTNRTGRSVSASSFAELADILPGLLWDSEIRSKVTNRLESFVPDGLAGTRVCDAMTMAVASMVIQEEVDA